MSPGTPRSAAELGRDRRHHACQADRPLAPGPGDDADAGADRDVRGDLGRLSGEQAQSARFRHLGDQRRRTVLRPDQQDRGRPGRLPRSARGGRTPGTRRAAGRRRRRRVRPGRRRAGAGRLLGRDQRHRQRHHTAPGQRGRPARRHRRGGRPVRQGVGGPLRPRTADGRHPRPRSSAARPGHGARPGTREHRHRRGGRARGRGGRHRPRGLGHRRHAHHRDRRRTVRRTGEGQAADRAAFRPGDRGRIPGGRLRRRPGLADPARRQHQAGDRGVRRQAAS